MYIESYSNQIIHEIPWHPEHLKLDAGRIHGLSQYGGTSGVHRQGRRSHQGSVAVLPRREQGELDPGDPFSVEELSEQHLSDPFEEEYVLCSSHRIFIDRAGIAKDLELIIATHMTEGAHPADILQILPDLQRF